MLDYLNPVVNNDTDLFKMARILITSGPTRQYLDPVRYLTNASSGLMGKSLAQAVIEAGHDAIVVSGPVSIEYPKGAIVIPVVSTEEMLDAARSEFPNCDGLIGVAAPCDYRPVQIHSNKISKTGQPLLLNLIETPDIVATLGNEKKDQWVVGFALESQDHRFRALVKLERKSCDLMVLNGPEAMNSLENQIEIIDQDGIVLDSFSGPKEKIAKSILDIIQKRLIDIKK